MPLIDHTCHAVCPLGVHPGPTAGWSNPASCDVPRSCLRFLGILILILGRAGLIRVQLSGSKTVVVSLAARSSSCWLLCTYACNGVFVSLFFAMLKSYPAAPGYRYYNFGAAFLGALPTITG